MSWNLALEFYSIPLHGHNRNDEKSFSSVIFIYFSFTYSEYFGFNTYYMYHNVTSLNNPLQMISPLHSLHLKSNQSYINLLDWLLDDFKSWGQWFP